MFNIKGPTGLQGNRGKLLQLPVFGTDKKLNSNQTLIKPPVYLALISDSHVYMNVFSKAHCVYVYMYVCVCVCVCVLDVC